MLFDPYKQWDDELMLDFRIAELEAIEKIRRDEERGRLETKGEEE